MKEIKYLAGFFATAPVGGIYLYIWLTVSIKHKYIKPLNIKTKEVYQIDGFCPSNGQTPGLFSTISPSTRQSNLVENQLTAVDGPPCTVQELGPGTPLKSTPTHSHLSYHCTPALVRTVKSRVLDRPTTTHNITHHTDGAIQRHCRWPEGGPSLRSHLAISTSTLVSNRGGEPCIGF